MKLSFYDRYRYWVFAFFIMLAPLVFYAANRAAQNSSNDVADWLPDSFAETQDLLWFAEHFGTDAILMISWQGCVVDDDRITELAAILRAPALMDGQSERVLFFKRVFSTREVINQLEQPPLELPKSAITPRLAGWMIGQDGETSCIVCVMSDDGWDNRHALLKHIRNSADKIDGLSGEMLHIAGSVVDSVAIDEASNSQLLSLGILSNSICFALMVALLRSFLLSVFVFVNALFCQQLGLAIVYASGTQMDSVLLMVPLLIYVLAVSAGVHIVNYYRDAVAEYGVENATARAVHDAAAPCWLASITTGLGMLSLTVSQLAPVQKFGVFACLAVLLGTLLLFTLLPCQLVLLSLKPLKSRVPQQEPPLLLRVCLKVVFRGGRWIALIGVTLAMLGFVGVTKLRSGVRLHDMFAPKAKILQDYDWLESRIGPLVPFEIVLRLPHTADDSPEMHPMLSRVQLVKSVHQAALATNGIGAVVSAWNFCPPMAGLEGTGVSHVIRRSVFNKLLMDSRDIYAGAGLLKVTPDEELWRISCRAYASQSVPYDQILNELQQRVDPILAAQARTGLADLRTVYCGGVPLVQRAQHQMLRDLLNSFLIAFVFIAGMMMLLMVLMSVSELRHANPLAATVIIFRSMAAGLIAMLPNILPCVLVLGAMGLAGMRIEIGSMMTASVALGIAVDDTLHFLTWFRRGLKAGHGRPEAVALAFVKCTAAILQTSLICGLGLLVFWFSPFIPISRFSWVMSAMLFAALLADLLILPALLLSPVGRLFEISSPLRRKPVMQPWGQT